LVTINSLICNEARIFLPVDPRLMTVFALAHLPEAQCRTVFRQVKIMKEFV